MPSQKPIMFVQAQLIFVVLFHFLIDLSRASTDYQQAALEEHNAYRKMHQAPPMKLNDKLSDRAIKCAEYYIARGKIDHSCKEKDGAGENLYMSWGSSKSDVEAAKYMVKSWYDEVSMHDYSKGFNLKTGHFTQVVWKGSTELGVGIAKGSGKTLVGCALYKPPGNYQGQFQENVLRPVANSRSSSTSENCKPCMLASGLLILSAAVMALITNTYML